LPHLAQGQQEQRQTLAMSKARGMHVFLSCHVSKTLCQCTLSHAIAFFFFLNLLPVNGYEIGDLQGDLDRMAE
jgi:hypothetical protein